LVPEHIVPYKASVEACDSKKTTMMTKLYSVKNYRYVGGAYGRVSEKEIMMEIKKNGPVVMSLEPPHDLMYYRRGIYEVKSDVPL
jgi:cathepsin C